MMVLQAYYDLYGVLPLADGSQPTHRISELLHAPNDSTLCQPVADLRETYRGASTMPGIIGDSVEFDIVRLYNMHAEFGKPGTVRLCEGQIQVYLERADKWLMDLWEK